MWAKICTSKGVADTWYRRSESCSEKGFPQGCLKTCVLPSHSTGFQQLVLLTFCAEVATLSFLSSVPDVIFPRSDLLALSSATLLASPSGSHVSESPRHLWQAVRLA